MKGTRTFSGGTSAWPSSSQFCTRTGSLPMLFSPYGNLTGIGREYQSRTLYDNGSLRHAGAGGERHDTGGKK
ncbi:hypothetical protein ACU4GD_39545 [Cupriavidus basilensis]